MVEGLIDPVNSGRFVRANDLIDEFLALHLDAKEMTGLQKYHLALKYLSMMEGNSKYKYVDRYNNTMEKRINLL